MSAAELLENPCMPDISGYIFAITTVRLHLESTQRNKMRVGAGGTFHFGILIPRRVPRFANRSTRKLFATGKTASV